MTPKQRFTRIRSFKDLRRWWNQVVDIKVKAVFLTVFLATFTVVGMQYQLNALTNDRIDATCQQRKESRDTIRSVMFQIIDLSDVLPGVPEAEAYTINRRNFIETNYPAITSDCATTP